MNTGYAGQFNAQNLGNWTSEWGGGTLPKAQHGTAKITPGLSIRMQPGGPWDTFYQLQRMPQQNAATTVTYRLVYQFPTDSDLALCQALEFEIQRNDGQRLLNGGVQFDLKGSKYVRTYDYAAGHWVPTGIKCDASWMAAGQPLEVVCVYDLTPSTITWRGLEINGTWNELGITRNASAHPQNPYLNYAFQYDFTSKTQAATLLMPAIDIVVT